MSFDNRNNSILRSESHLSEISSWSQKAVSRRPSNMISRILTKTVNVSANEVLAAEDVTIESKKAHRVYALANFFTLILEYVAILTLQLGWLGKIRIFTLDKSHNDLPIVPVYVNNIFLDIGWLTALTLQLLFVLRGLPFMKPGTHYINCLLLKIKWWFIVLCLLMSLSLISYSFAVD